MITSLDRMTWRQADAYFQENDTVLFPLGCTHSHDHIIMGIDNEAAVYIAEEVAQRTGIIRLPCLNYGWMPHYNDFPGSISIDSSLVRDLVIQVVRQMRKWGVRKVIFINGHGGNSGYLEEVSLEARTMGVLTPVLEWFNILREPNEDMQALRAEAKTEELAGSGTLRGTETAFALGMSPEFVDTDNIRFIETPHRFGAEIVPNWFQGVWYRNVHIPLPIHVWEASRMGPKAKGPDMELSQRMVRVLIDYIVDFAKEFKQVSPLDPVERGQHNLGEEQP